MTENISILGSTGSIGQQTLEIVENNREKFAVYALAANNNIELLEKQIHKFRPEIVVVTDKKAAEALFHRLGNLKKPEIRDDICGLEEIVSAQKVDIALVAVTGIIGLKPTLAAVKAGKKVALANKETLVAAGEIVMKEVKEYKVEIIPVDSEHSAIFQCLKCDDKNVKNLILTASGGPFRECQYEELLDVTPERALEHPNWSMGNKISIDSATMMNKGLELIEARWLFDISYENIKVVIHPQSIVHSMVEYVDGSIIAQLGITDMKLPIQYALTYPDRFPLDKKLDLSNITELSFEEPKDNLFPCLELAKAAGKKGGIMPAVLNAANEAAVHLFLRRKISFLKIPHLVEMMLEKVENITNPDLDTIIETDEIIRKKMYEYI